MLGRRQGEISPPSPSSAYTSLQVVSMSARHTHHCHLTQLQNSAISSSQLLSAAQNSHTFCSGSVRLSRMPLVKRAWLTRPLVTTMRSVFSTSLQCATSATHPSG